MVEKCQIIKTSVSVSCETYNCHKKVSYAIGRPDGPPQLWRYLCEDCTKDMLSCIPEELQPEPAKIYTCDYCGESFDASIKLATHSRTCEARKEVLANG